MPVAALYDIHGNLPALEAVLEEVRAESVDRIVIGGDIVPGPLPRETFELLLNLQIPVDFTRGNGDRAVLDVMNGFEETSVPEHFRPIIRWTAEQLNDSHRRILESWPPTFRLDVDGVGRVLCCNATPDSNMPIFSRATSEEKLMPIFSALDVDLVVCGHTHMQFDRKVGP